jgi:murein DD-endopeptidase MepM/ murein hydrolase activator NlpD
MLLIAVVGFAGPARAADPDGGAAVPEAPLITRVACLADALSPCPSGRTLARGRSFQIRGENLAHVERIVFLGRPGRADDATARVAEADARTIAATAPAAARSGRLVLVERFGRRTRSRRAVRVRSAPAAEPLDIAPGSRFFFDGRRKPHLDVEVSQAETVRVELVSDETGAPVRSWDVAASPGQPVEVRWDGKGASGVERPGSYSFRLAGGGSARAATTSTQSFFFADHLFPIRGRHDLGQSNTNNFGGGRGHRGQDMFARCGTRLAAARGGRVQYAGYHSAAGNYLVIDGVATGTDYVYMHMRGPALVQTGDRVFTGQAIGQVGETGRASGCHLHFELWSAPGWYEGGRPFDPLPSLRAWDDIS